MAGSDLILPKHLPRNLGEEAINEVADRVAKKPWPPEYETFVASSSVEVGTKVVFIYTRKHARQCRADLSSVAGPVTNLTGR
jgi:hypothetical protein